MFHVIHRVNWWMYISFGNKLVVKMSFLRLAYLLHRIILSVFIAEETYILNPLLLARHVFIHSPPFHYKLLVSWTIFSRANYSVDSIQSAIDNDTKATFNLRWHMVLAQEVMAMAWLKWLELAQHVHVIIQVGNHWLRQWFNACLAPRHRLNQCWFVVNQTLRTNFSE